MLLPTASSDLPACQNPRTDPEAEASKHAYMILLQVGVAMPRLVTKLAVRSYRTVSPLPPLCTFIRHAGCGEPSPTCSRTQSTQVMEAVYSLLPCSVRSPCLGVTQHLVLVEPGLSSSIIKIPAVIRSSRKKESNTSCQMAQGIVRSILLILK